ncbi:hypothetical protein IMCC3317_45160 [Kordia antarctica]|uniref:Uncharacterized protein n=1 Tax=Kordia antarctica TaxID=1218801 RepID=A0A7L4ZR35_9FLAO|nr:hypothetical protein [Kordia antarctica]QHI39115.1 hypothetical protein IMCC3317_45160 [Kordia antarctica]
MPKKSAKKLVRNFYFYALLLNVVLPWILAKSIVGDSTGEVGLIYIFVIIWAVVSIVVYTIYFAIPDFPKNWEKIATFLFPSLFISPLLFFAFRLILIPLIINFIFNGICMLYYRMKMKKIVIQVAETI